MAKGLSKSANRAIPAPLPESAVPVQAGVDWAAVVQQIVAGDQKGIETLHATFSRGLRYFLSRKLGGHEYEDTVQDTLVAVIAAVRRGQIREPERLPGFVRTIATRNAFLVIGKRVRSRQEVELDAGVNLYVPDTKHNPEKQAMIREHAELMRKALEMLPRRQREVLERFYLREQAPEQICSEMHLTETQFRLLKSRAKAHFGDVGKEQLSKRRLPLSNASVSFGRT